MNIAVVTNNRSEYGILRGVLAILRKSHKVVVIATGEHITQETISEIYVDTDEVVIMKEAKELPFILGKENIQLVILLGDRYETLEAAVATVSVPIEILHIHGGETTKGSMDDKYRDAISMLSTYHCTAAEPFSDKLRRMGCTNVHTTGSPSLAAMQDMKKMLLSDVEDSLGFKLDGLVLFTYHPVTVGDNNTVEEVKVILSAVEETGIKLLITGSNNDMGKGEAVNEFLRTYARDNGHHFVHSLGYTRYISTVPWMKFVMGNSSSGLIEVPHLKVPTLNIGTRQEGRLSGSSVLHVPLDTHEIVKGIKLLTHPVLSTRYVGRSPYHKFGTLANINALVEDISNEYTKG